MKYPYIGKSDIGNEFLIASSDSAFHIKEQVWISANNESSNLRDITQECLANTCGKVESIEHAEFIKLLAESNDIRCSHKNINEHCLWFYFVGYDLFFTHIKLNIVDDFHLINLPLPPKEDEEVQHNELVIDITNNTNHEIKVTKDDAEKVITVTIGDDTESSGPFKNPVNNAGTIKMPKDELPNNGDNLMFSGEDKCKNQVSKIDYDELLKNHEWLQNSHDAQSTILQLLMLNGVDVKKLNEIGMEFFNTPHSKNCVDWRKDTLKALEKAINAGEDRCSEWPSVGDEVSLRYKFDSKKIMHTGKLLYLSNSHIIIDTEDGSDCHRCRRDWIIEKPQSPVQELANAIVEKLGAAVDVNDLELVAELILNDTDIKKYLSRK